MSGTVNFCIFRKNFSSSKGKIDTLASFHGKFIMFADNEHFLSKLIRNIQGDFNDFWEGFWGFKKDLSRINKVGLRNWRDLHEFFYRDYNLRSSESQQDFFLIIQINLWMRYFIISKLVFLYSKLIRWGGNLFSYKQ